VSKRYVNASAKGKSSKTAEAIDVAARYLVYQLFEATDGMQGAWHVLGKIGERPATVARAIERGSATDGEPEVELEPDDDESPS
jgi:hypothetical protein